MPSRRLMVDPRHDGCRLRPLARRSGAARKDTFFAAVSHELRTPLTALSGWIALVERATDDPELVGEGLANMSQSVEMLTKLVNDLLDTVRARHSKMEVTQKRVELAPIVSAAVQAFRQQWETKRLSVAQTLDDGLFVLGDPTRLHQVVWNLVTNAIKHTPDGGSIEIGLRSGDGNGVIEVRDSGDGIDPAFLPYIFEPFRQQAGDGDGVGLCLAIARSLVEAHGGHHRRGERRRPPGRHLPRLTAAAARRLTVKRKRRALARNPLPMGSGVSLRKGIPRQGAG